MSDVCEFYPAAWMAERTGLSEDTVRRMAQRGEMPHHKTGRWLRFTEDDLAEYKRLTAVPARGSGRTRQKRTRRAA